MTATTELIRPLGAPMGEADKLTKRGVEVLVQEHEDGWSIIGSRSDRQPASGPWARPVWTPDPRGAFVAVIHRCTPESCRCALHPYEHRRSKACRPHERNCLGHADNVSRLARKILDTYKASA